MMGIIWHILGMSDIYCENENSLYYILYYHPSVDNRLSCLTVHKTKTFQRIILCVIYSFMCSNYCVTHPVCCNCYDCYCYIFCLPQYVSLFSVGYFIFLSFVWQTSIILLNSLYSLWEKMKLCPVVQRWVSYKRQELLTLRQHMV